MRADRRRPHGGDDDRGGADEQEAELKQLARSSCFIYIGIDNTEDFTAAIKQIRHLVGFFGPSDQDPSLFFSLEKQGDLSFGQVLLLPN